MNDHARVVAATRGYAALARGVDAERLAGELHHVANELAAAWPWLLEQFDRRRPDRRN